MIAIKIDSSAVQRLLAQAQTLGQEPQLLNVAGRGVAEKLRGHFATLDQTRPNKLGGKRTYFWGQVRRSVQNPVVTPPSASVSINHLGIAQRLFGGVIRPVRAKFLAIPARPEAYGKGPREFRDLHFQPTRRGGALVENLRSDVTFGRKKKDGTRTVTNRGERGGLVMFWLVKQVVQRPDPTVLPPPAELETAARVPMESYLSRKLGGGK